MIPIKIQCECGQRYAFDVEPVNGRLASAVACPVCAADGTATANEMITQALLAQPRTAPAPDTTLRTAAPVTHVAPPPVPRRPPAIPNPRPSMPTKLTWYEQLWIALPLGLIAVGGMIGGACGGLAWGINKTVFKQTENQILRYVWTGLISVASVVAWLMLVTFVFTLIKKH